MTGEEIEAKVEAEKNRNKNTHAFSYEGHNRILLLGEADFSFARAFAQECVNNDNMNMNIKIQVTATEYGDGNDIAKRYYDGNVPNMRSSISSLCQMEVIKEVICGLNARVLGQTSADLCPCQKWNKVDKCWDPSSPFWNSESGPENVIDTYFDLIVFNFPHSEQAGRATKLVRALFKQLRICIDTGRLPGNVVLEMRLRVIESNPNLKKNIRSFYNHEEAAIESGFELIGCWPSDLTRWENLGYRHMWTKKNATCRDIGLNCNVWRWRSAKRDT